ncbi:MAG: aminopeptidase, partial [Butyricicoccus sp.]|nr:aminopeptidase [Butyricicoccus sp.]
MDVKELKKALLMENKNGYSKLNETDRKAMNAYCDGYKAFLDAGKTERECVTEAIRLAEAQGFKKLERGMELKAGDKVYANNRGKMLTLAVIGTEPLEKG